MFPVASILPLVAFVVAVRLALRWRHYLWGRVRDALS